MTDQAQAAANLAVHIASLRDKYPGIEISEPELTYYDRDTMHRDALALATPLALSWFNVGSDFVTLGWKHTTQAGHVYNPRLRFRLVDSGGWAATMLDRD